jgi:hypothetical protein
MADFERLNIHEGRGAFHLNRFRIAFEPPAGFTKETLARDFVTNFPTYLKSSVASVEFRKDRPLDGKTTLKFLGALKLLWNSVDANPGAHHDWVVQEWVDQNVGFTAQTLKRTFFDSDDAAAAGGAFIGSTPLLIPMLRIGSMVLAADVNRYHFLAGRRSWRLDTAAAFGQAAGDFDAGSSDLWILETVAVERFSHIAFMVGDYVLGFEERVPAVWIALLENFVKIKALKVRKIFMPKPADVWENTTMGWVRYHADKFDNLAALKADRHYVDFTSLYPTVLPPPP